MKLTNKELKLLKDQREASYTAIMHFAERLEGIVSKNIVKAIRTSAGLGFNIKIEDTIK